MCEDFENLAVLHENCLPARSWFIPLADSAERKSAGKFGKNSSRFYLLSGEGWEFRYVTSPLLIDKQPNPEWKRISIPSCWQTTGCENPFYVNNDFTCPANPPRVPVANPVGIYRRTFEYKTAKNCTGAILTFLGVCSAFHVYINGNKVGYSQGSHNMSEFDVARYLVQGKNELLVYVYKWSDGSYLESQDMFRYNGIFRDVYLTQTPEGSIYDFRWQIKQASDGAYGCKVSIVMRGKQEPVHVRLFYGNDLVVQGVTDGGVFECNVGRPVLWNAEKPELYDLVLTVGEGKGERECVHSRVGFKTIDATGPEFRVNGSPIKIKGINLHESHYKNGWTVSDEDCERDIRLAKSLNVNAVRFAHYPPTPIMLQLCDEYGLYVIDEADLETYGSLNMSNIDYFGQNKEWLPSFLDRMERLWQRDKNHVCVIMWSMGNEAGRGENFDRCYEYLKSMGDNIPVHYETCFRYEGERGYDILSLQYSDFKTIEERMRADDHRPFFLCEYAHCMGAGPGSLKEYWEYVYKYDKFIGGCVWEWCDHAYLQNRDETDPAKYEYTYGGDHGEYAHDKNFCCDGMVYPDRSLSPAAYEIKNAYRPVRCSLVSCDKKGCTLSFFNTNTFTDSGAYKIVLRRKYNGITVKEESLSLAVAPLQKESLRVEFAFDGRERVIEAETYAGEESLGFDSILLEEILPPVSIGTLPKKQNDEAGVTLGEWSFDHYLRTIVQPKIFTETPYNKGYGAFCKNVTGFFPAIWRAPIDNDRPIVQQWYEKLYHEMWLSFYERKEGQGQEGYFFEQSGYLTPPKYEPMFAVSTKYTFGTEGVRIKASLTPLRDGLPPLPRFGMRAQLNEGMRFVRWYGLGRGENYPDFAEGARYGIFESDSEGLHEPYIRPQENGTRCGVRWLEVFDSAGEGLRIEAIGKPFAFSLRPYGTEDLEKAQHRGELKRRPFNELSIDGFVRGLGSAACGMLPQERYVIPQKKGETLTFEFSVKTIRRER